MSTNEDKDKGGRPSKLTPEVERLIVAMIHSGAFPWVAAGAAGISIATHQRWMVQGKKESDAQETDESLEVTAHAGYYRAITKARMMCRLDVEKNVRKQNPLAWLRMGPGRDKPGEEGWTDRQTVELTGKNGGPIQTETMGTMDLRNLTDDELAAFEALTRKCLPAGPPPTGES